MSLEERKRLFKLTADHLSGELKVICSVMAVTTGEILELTESAKAVGADAVMCLPPHGVVPTRRELVHLYRTISETVDIPIMVYNLPTRAAINITPDIVDELADIKNVVAIKESSNNINQLVETIMSAGDRISIFVGYEHGVLPGIIMGAEGVSSVLPQILGRDAIDLCFYAMSGEIEKARPLQFKAYTVFNGMEGAGNFPAWFKEAMNQLGYPAGYPRLPQLPLTANEKAQVTRVLKKLDLL
jgi:4-hydroxy-tetrahydrodipicolinate synthase